MVQGFVGHDRILVVLAVILAKETLFDRKESSTLTASRPAGLHGARERTVGIITLPTSAPRSSGRSTVLRDVFRCSLPELPLIYVYFFLFF
ncbi:MULTISPECIES: hypothetical protein [unclassified Microcoleus]|uniref:hypothetical protein n=1 Tax=unclassified Microcoleus TaxID=2642155 RepID=UPI002FD59A63